MLFYHQSTGQLTCDSDPLNWQGYAGNGDGLNNPAMQDVVGKGPLPQNVYRIGIPHNSPHTGIATMNLEPVGPGDMFGRSLLRMHGDNKLGNRTASDGCIIMPFQIRLKVAKICGWDVMVGTEPLRVTEFDATAERLLTVLA